MQMVTRSFLQVAKNLLKEGVCFALYKKGALLLVFCVQSSDIVQMEEWS
jgi:hypothetical protein